MREKGNLLELLQKLHHHVGQTVAPILMLEAPEYRCQLVAEGIGTAMTQIRKIWEIAKKNKLKEILDVLEETVEFGHDY